MFEPRKMPRGSSDYLVPELKVSEEFKSLIPPLTNQEYEMLEADCLENGIRHKIITWNDTIVDGHNRYAIAKKHTLRVEIEEMDFENEDAAKLHIIDTQLARRNITTYARIELLGARKPLLLSEGRRKMKEGGKGLSKLDRPSHSTQQITADALNISTGTLGRAEFVQKHASDDVLEKARSGEMSIHEAYMTVQKDKQRQKLGGSKDEGGESLKTPERPCQHVNIYDTDQKFRILLADPPWPNSAGTKAAPDGDKTMSVGDICNVPVGDIAEADAMLFLWVPSAMLEVSFDVIHAWGFTYKSSLVWDRVKNTSSSADSVRHEFLLECVKGNCTPDIEVRNDSVITIGCSDDDSEKPMKFIDLIDSAYPDGERIELFAKDERRANWSVWEMNNERSVDEQDPQDSRPE